MNIKKVLSIVLITVMFITIIPLNVFAVTNYSDTKGHWAEDAIEKWSEYGILLGYPEGNFLPGNGITRAEMAAIINRVVVFTERAGSYTFSDVNATDWFADDILKLNAAGIILGTNGRANPAEKITRQEAVAMLARAFDIQDSNTRTNFVDESLIDSWALPYIRGMKSRGFISGYTDGKFDPKGILTRAEVVTMLDNMIEKLYNSSGNYGNYSNKTTVYGNVVISSRDVNLTNMDIKGDVYLTQGVEYGNVEISNTSVSGTVYIWSSGSNNITLSSSNITNVVLTNSSNELLVLNSTVKTIGLDSGTVTLSSRSDVNTINSTGGSINVESNSDLNKIEAKSTRINIKSSATVATLIINEGAGSSLTVDGTVNNLTLNEDINVYGNGTIKSSNIASEKKVRLQSVTADGSSTTLTTKLTLTFDKDIADLHVRDITLTESNSSTPTNVTKGTLTKVANRTGVYELTVSGITRSGYISVGVSKSDYEFTNSAQSVYINYISTTNVYVSNLYVDGNQYERTTKLIISFDRDISYLYASDFKITNGTGRATIGTLKPTNNIREYELSLNVTASGTISLELSKTGYTFTQYGSSTPQTSFKLDNILVYYSTTISATLQSVTADGSSSSTTTKLTLTFDKNIGNLYTSDITISGTGRNNITLNSINNPSSTTGRVYELYVTVTGSGSISVGVSKTNYSITNSSYSVSLYYVPEVTTIYPSISQESSAQGITNKLIITFDKDVSIQGLSVRIINAGITKAVFGDLTGSGKNYTVPINNVELEGTLIFEIKKDGYEFYGSPFTIQINYTAPEPPDDSEETEEP